jgi:hypothetical protein
MYCLFSYLMRLHSKTIEPAMFGLNVANKRYSDLSSDDEIVVEAITKISVVPDIPIVLIRPSFQYRLVSGLGSLTVNYIFGECAWSHR